MKNVYLQTMGIITWRLRTYSYHLIDREGQVVGVLLAQVYSNPERELLEAIRKALPIVTREGQWDGNEALLIFGSPTLSSSDSKLIFSTHSLTAMLKNPKLKAEVWKE